MADLITVGEQKKLKGLFFNSTGVAADPTTVKCAYKPPLSAKVSLTFGTDAELVKDSTGVYYVNVLMTEAGRWQARFQSSGNIIAADDTDWEVRPAGVTVD